MKTALHPDEKVIYFARQHWVVYFVGLIASMAVGFAGYAISGLLIGIPLGILTLFYFYLLRKNNIWVVTNKRFIDEWGVFVVNTKETPLDKINNVGYQKTPIGMILGFGNVSIQSAAEAGVTYAKWVPKPEMLVSIIQQTQAKSGKPDEEDLIECPYCKEKIKKGAVLCRFCGSRLDKPQQVIKKTETQKDEAVKESAVEDIKEEEVINEEENLYRRKANLWRPGR
ncbi:PH domain-containing protein [Thermodesulfovibrio thiophilus]|uniref:PH domain-containing protein n=1 Tax=Thermodesulfovibrio thiophilus TaxID=340095 RepID=UPI0004297F7C|nr:PH domain-containing protein [Thermodesulfovibrio thiophilus]